MEKILMNGDTPVLAFDLDEPYIEVLNNDFLPYALRDYVETTGKGSFRKSIHDISVFRDFLASRTLNLSRDNAKAILNIVSLPQTLKTDDRIKIALTCRGLTMTDNFWIREKNEDVSFNQVSLRHTRLSEASYQVAILGKHISATAEELRPDLSTAGMFPKYWARFSDTVVMCKTDKYKGNPNTLAEIECSAILKEAGAYVVRYKKSVMDGMVFSLSRCIANDERALVSASDIRDWCNHKGESFYAFLEKRFKKEFADMAVADYVTANTDRHFENWGFLVDNSTNEISAFSPLFDLNQSLIADQFDSDIGKLVYEPTGKSFEESAAEYAALSGLDFSGLHLPGKCRERWEAVKEARSY